MVKDKTQNIPIESKESNVTNVKDLVMSKLNVWIFLENKEKTIIPPFWMVGMMKKVSYIKQIIL